MNKVLICLPSAKNCARQIVKEAFNDIICGNFIIPSQREMEPILKDFIDYDFDEYKMKKKIMVKQPSWGKDQINADVHRLKVRY